MYCNFCGNALYENQTVCSKCNNAIARGASTDRMEHHLKLLGILWIADAVLHVIGGCVLLIVANTIFARSSDGDHPAFLHPLLIGIAFVVLARAAGSLIAGFGLFERQSWARPLALVMAFLALINVPFGTALGVYTLWLLMSPQADIEYRRLAASA